MSTCAAATIGAPSSAYIPARDPKQTIIATAEWMMLRSVTTARPAPTTPMASRKKRTLEMMSRVDGSLRIRAHLGPLGAALDSSVACLRPALAGPGMLSADATRQMLTGRTDGESARSDLTYAAVAQH